MGNKVKRGTPDTTEKPHIDEEPVNGDHFLMSLLLIGVVVVASVIFVVMQGGAPFLTVICLF